MLGYSIYVNDATGDKVTVRDYDVDLARVSNNESAIYHDRVDLINADMSELASSDLGDR